MIGQQNLQNLVVWPVLRFLLTKTSTPPGRPRSGKVAPEFFPVCSPGLTRRRRPSGIWAPAKGATARKTGLLLSSLAHHEKKKSLKSSQPNRRSPPGRRRGRVLPHRPRRVGSADRSAWCAGCVHSRHRRRQGCGSVAGAVHRGGHQVHAGDDRPPHAGRRDGRAGAVAFEPRGRALARASHRPVAAGRDQDDAGAGCSRADSRCRRPARCTCTAPR